MSKLGSASSPVFSLGRVFEADARHCSDLNEYASTVLMICLFLWNLTCYMLVVLGWVCFSIKSVATLGEYHFLEHPHWNCGCHTAVVVSRVPCFHGFVINWGLSASCLSSRNLFQTWMHYFWEYCFVNLSIFSLVVNLLPSVVWNKI